MRTCKLLERYALAGAHGRDWYGDTRDAVVELAGVLHVTPEYLAGVLAITSPRVHVVRNITLTVAYISRGSLEGTLPGVQAALAHFEDTGEIRGPKTSAFARALMGDGDAIVLDVWMARALNVDQARLGGVTVRREAERRVRRVARRLGWTPAEVQAAIWTHWVETHRDSRGRRTYKEAPSFSELLRAA
jgi:hypothetical protein